MTGNNLFGWIFKNIQICLTPKKKRGKSSSTCQIKPKYCGTEFNWWHTCISYTHIYVPFKVGPALNDVYLCACIWLLSLPVASHGILTLKSVHCVCSGHLCTCVRIKCDFFSPIPTFFCWPSWKKNLRGGDGGARGVFLASLKSTYWTVTRCIVCKKSFGDLQNSEREIFWLQVMLYIWWANELPC